MTQGMDVALLGDRWLHPAVAEECNGAWCSVGLAAPQHVLHGFDFEVGWLGLPPGPGPGSIRQRKRGFS